MKLVNFEVSCRTGPHRRVGILDGDRIVDVYATQQARDRIDATGATVGDDGVPGSMIGLLRAGERGSEMAQGCLDVLSSGKLPRSSSDPQLVYDRSAVRLLSPLLRPNSIRDCTVYEGHLLNCRDIERGSLPDAYYEYPLYYKGNPDAIVHPEESVAWPAYTDELDFELELAAIVGRRGRDIDAAEAERYIAGYTIFDDFSARDIQAEAKPVMLGPSKSKDFANGFGPCLVTADSIDPTDLAATVRVNDEVWSETATDGMYHSWGEIIEHISEGITLHPGDVIGCGTVPLGCGLELDRWLQPGDQLELTVEEIGTLRHRIVAE